MNFCCITISLWHRWEFFVETMNWKLLSFTGHDHLAQVSSASILFLYFSSWFFFYFYGKKGIITIKKNINKYNQNIFEHSYERGNFFFTQVHCNSIIFKLWLKVHNSYAWKLIWNKVKCQFKLASLILFKTTCNFSDSRKCLIPIICLIPETQGFTHMELI